jgi:hypothetical protein
MTIEYDEGKLPEGVAEKNLVVVTFNGTAGEWEVLESVVDLENNAVKAKVGHFTAFAVVAYTRPAEFNVTDLSITPDEANLGEPISVGVLVTNEGDLAGSHEVTLQVGDGTGMTRQEITLDGGSSQEISFLIIPETAGEHAVNIGGLVGICRVIEPEAPAAFNTSALSISPSEVGPDESVTITVLITNTGDLSGRYEVRLAIDGIEVQTEAVELDGGQAEELSFTAARDTAGAYAIELDGLTGSFTVREPAPPEAVAQMPSEPASQSEPEPVPVTEPAPALEPAPSVSWPLLGGVIAAAMAAGLVSYFIVRRKRSRAVDSGKNESAAD